MSNLFNLCFILWLLHCKAYSDWVEIPQYSHRKNFLTVTPHDPYIYAPSLVFTSHPTVSYEDTLPPPMIVHSVNNLHMKLTEPKKSTPRMPDFVIRQPLTTPATLQKTTRSFFLDPNRNSTRKNSHAKPNKKYKIKSTYQTPQIAVHPPASTAHTKYTQGNDQYLGDEEEYEEEYVYDDDENGEVLPEDDTELSPGPADSSEDNPEYYYDDSESVGPADEEQVYYEDEYDESLPENDEDRDGEDYEDDQDYQQKHNKEKGSSQGYFGFLPFLQRIQDTLLFRNSDDKDKNSKGDSVEGKVSFLEGLKNRLLFTIKSKINNLWPARTKRETSRGDWYPEMKGDSSVGFPSNEAALLSLAFLTFAVFLIKCILKLIHALKKKHHGHKVIKIPIILNNMTSTTVATYRLKREEINDQLAHVMSNIENFKYNNN